MRSQLNDSIASYLAFTPISTMTRLESWRRLLFVNWQSTSSGILSKLPSSISRISLFCNEMRAFAFNFVDLCALSVFSDPDFNQSPAEKPMAMAMPWQRQANEAII